MSCGENNYKAPTGRIKEQTGDQGAWPPEWDTTGRKAAQILQGLSAMANFTLFTSQEEAIQIVKASESCVTYGKPPAWRVEDRLEGIRGKYRDQLERSSLRSELVSFVYKTS